MIGPLTVIASEEDPTRDVFPGLPTLTELGVAKNWCQSVSQVLTAKLVLLGSSTNAPVVVIFKSTPLYWNESALIVMFALPALSPEVVDAQKLVSVLAPLQSKMFPFAVVIVPSNSIAREFALPDPTAGPLPTVSVAPPEYGTQVSEPPLVELPPNQTPPPRVVILPTLASPPRLASEKSDQSTTLSLPPDTVLEFVIAKVLMLMRPFA